MPVITDTVVIVGGRTERDSFTRWFSKKNIRFINAISAKDPPAGLAKKILAAAMPSKGRMKKIYVFLDRESSDEVAVKLEKILLEKILK